MLLRQSRGRCAAICAIAQRRKLRTERRIAQRLREIRYLIVAGELQCGRRMTATELSLLLAVSLEWEKMNKARVARGLHSVCASGSLAQIQFDLAMYIDALTDVQPTK